MITPCISVCKIDNQTRTCLGCGRTIDEITQWSKYSDDERMQVMKRLGYAKRTGRGEKLRRYERDWYTQREWDRCVGYDTVPEEYKKPLTIRKE